MKGTLHGVGLKNMTKKDIQEIKKLENYVYKTILEARRYAATSELCKLK